MPSMHAPFRIPRRNDWDKGSPNDPGQATIKAAEKELRIPLNAWEVAYRKESFYNGLRALLEISRNGESRR